MYFFALCFFHLTIYPGIHFVSATRDLHSFFKVAYIALHCILQFIQLLSYVWEYFTITNNDTTNSFVQIHFYADETISSG